MILGIHNRGSHPGDSGVVIAATGRSAKGFSLVELVIVIAILGILAALVVPKFSNASDTANANSLREDLRSLRTQIMLYRAEHNNVSPGYPSGNISATPTQAAFVAQMTQYTAVDGRTSPTPSSTYRLGYYLSNIPVNAVNGSSDIVFVDDNGSFPTAPAGGSAGWMYQPSSGLIAANLAGADANSVAYFDY